MPDSPENEIAIDSDMRMMQGPFPPMPQMRTLRIFESAARQLSFSAAAAELHTTQPSVSRAIADLERKMGVRLFERGHRAITLTPAGEIFHRAVVIGLSRIAAGTLTASNLADGRRVVVASSHALSHQFLMPRFDTLRRALGEDVSLRILTLDYDLLDRLDDSEIDLALDYDTDGSASGDRAVLFREAVAPVCSPGFAAEHARVLARPVKEWGSLPFLRLARPATYWATWHDWFESAGYPVPPPRYDGIEDYVYLVEEAVAGRGLALGWRHFVDRQLEEGRLVTVTGGFVELDRHCFARLTERGSRRPAARRCLGALAALADVTARGA